MAMNGETVTPSTNGTVPDPERRVSSVGYVATSNSAANRRARNEHVADLQERVEKCEENCKNARAQIVAAEERQDSIPDHHRGWPLEIVAVLALISVFFEYMPASLFTQVFTSATTNLQLHLLTIVFTIIGALLAVVLGELFRRTREPVRHHVRETVLFAVVAAFTVGVSGARLRAAACVHERVARCAARDLRTGGSAGAHRHRDHRYRAHRGEQLFPRRLRSVRGALGNSGACVRSSLPTKRISGPTGATSSARSDRLHTTANAARSRPTRRTAKTRTRPEPVAPVRRRYRPVPPTIASGSTVATSALEAAC